jgi:hypothetical protein
LRAVSSRDSFGVPWPTGWSRIPSLRSSMRTGFTDAGAFERAGGKPDATGIANPDDLEADGTAAGHVVTRARVRRRARLRDRLVFTFPRVALIICPDIDTSRGTAGASRSGPAEFSVIAPSSRSALPASRGTCASSRCVGSRSRRVMVASALSTGTSRSR